MNIQIASILLLSVFLVASCSDDEDKNKNELTGEHVWKEQTDTMDKARAVEGMLEDAAQEQREMIEQNVQ